MSQPPQQQQVIYVPVPVPIPVQAKVPLEQVYQFPVPAHRIPHPTSAYQIATPLTRLNAQATPADCPVCGQREVTKVKFVSGGTTHTWAFLMCFATLFLGWVPYKMDSLKDAEHRCGSCGVLLAKWHRNGGVVEPSLEDCLIFRQ